MTTPSAAEPGTPVAHTEEFEVILISEDGVPGYGVMCPTLPGCNSQGDDWDDALAMIAEAIEGFLLHATRPDSVDGRKERLMAEYAADGCEVEVATVRVML